MAGVDLRQRHPMSGAAGRRARALEEARVLVVEDDDDVRLIYQVLLRDRVGEVVACASGADALDLLLASDFDILLSDVGLPGLSGSELAELARRLFPWLGIVLATGYAADVGPAAAALRARVLSKPFGIDEFAATVRGALDDGAEGPGRAAA